MLFLMRIFGVAFRDGDGWCAAVTTGMAYAGFWYVLVQEGDGSQTLKPYYTSGTCDKAFMRAVEEIRVRELEDGGIIEWEAPDPPVFVRYEDSAWTAWRNRVLSTAIDVARVKFKPILPRGEPWL